MHVYNAHATGWPTTGINEAEILVSTVNSGDRGDWSSVAWNAADGILDINPDTEDPFSVDEIVELDDLDGQYVLISVFSNHGAPWGTGAAEFRFFAVPEPSTTVLMALGSVLLFGLRRRS